MSGSGLPAPDFLARVVAARQKLLGFRLGLAVIMVAVFQVMTGWPVVLGWVLVYVSQQAIEHRYFGRISPSDRLSPSQARRALVSMFISNVIFGALGVAEAYLAGPWGLVCGCLLWSGAILNAAMGSAGSLSALIAWTTPPVAYFLSAPFFVVYNRAPLAYGLVIFLAGFLNALAAVAIWSGAQKRLQAEERERFATHVARHDPETGLANRLAFEQELAALLGRERTVVVGVLGIDRFADLRGAIGYALAARLITKAALRLSDAHAGPIARLSASTLGVIFHSPDAAQARAYVSRLQSAMARPIAVDTNHVDVSLTIGLAGEWGGHTKDPLLECASIALDAARKAKISVKVFDSAQFMNPTGSLSLMSELLRSIKLGEITNHYQPKFHLQSGRLVGVETLVRWHHGQRGIIPPDSFIPMAEETGRIRELTLDVLARAVRDQVRLAERKHALEFAINLSGRLLHDDDIIGTVLEIVRPAVAQISLEITETAMMENPEKALALLHQLRSAGVEISIDDYGSGLSSLAYLKKIPADELKIDKFFVAQMDSDRGDSLLVRSTIALAHSLGLRVVAEGVESGPTLRLLKSMDCDLAQGYYMARPMPLDKLIELMDTGASLCIEPALI